MVRKETVAKQGKEALERRRYALGKSSNNKLGCFAIGRSIVTNNVSYNWITMVPDSIDSILQLPNRKLVVAENDVYLDKKTKNEIFILMVQESKGSAGGRAGGSGHRHIARIYGFACDGGGCRKFFESSEIDEVEKFEIPYSSVAMDIRLSDGREYIVQGVVDPGFVASYHSVINNLK